MPDNPNTAEPGKPRRRWFQFRLRTLLITVVAAACGLSAWIGWQYSVASRRQSLIQTIYQRGGMVMIVFPGVPEDIPFLRHVFGDREVTQVLLPPDAYKTDEDVARIVAVFPEVKKLWRLDRPNDGTPNSMQPIEIKR